MQFGCCVYFAGFFQILLNNDLYDFQLPVIINTYLVKVYGCIGLKSKALFCIFYTDKMIILFD